MIDKELKALRLSLVRKRDSYNMQAYYLEKDISTGSKTIKQAIQASKEAQVLKSIACDINDILYPAD